MSRTALRNQPLDDLGDVVLPRDLMQRINTMGHAHWSTTLVCYHHFPWLLTSRSQARLRAVYMKRFGAASVMGIGVTFVDEITQKALQAAEQATIEAFRTTKGVPKTPEARDAQCRFEAQAWMDQILPRRALPLPPVRPELDEVRPAHQWTACELGAILARVGRLESLERALAVAGGHPEDAQHIREALAPFELRLGRRLTKEVIDEASELPKWVAHPPTPDSSIRLVWKAFDEDPGFASGATIVALMIYDAMHPKHADRVRIRRSMTERLKAVLRVMGVDDRDIELTALPAGMCELRVSRPKSRKSGEGALRQQRFVGIAIKWALGVIWLVHRLRQESENALHAGGLATRAD